MPCDTSPIQRLYEQYLNMVLPLRLRLAVTLSEVLGILLMAPTDSPVRLAAMQRLADETSDPEIIIGWLNLGISRSSDGSVCARRDIDNNDLIIQNDPALSQIVMGRLVSVATAIEHLWWPLTHYTTTNTLRLLAVAKIDENFLPPLLEGIGEMDFATLRNLFGLIPGDSRHVETVRTRIVTVATISQIQRLLSGSYSTYKDKGLPEALLAKLIATAENPGTIKFAHEIAQSRRNEEMAAKALARSEEMLVPSVQQARTSGDWRQIVQMAIGGSPTHNRALEQLNLCLLDELENGADPRTVVRIATRSSAAKYEAARILIAGATTPEELSVVFHVPGLVLDDTFRGMYRERWLTVCSLDQLREETEKYRTASPLPPESALLVYRRLATESPDPFEAYRFALLTTDETLITDAGNRIQGMIQQAGKDVEALWEIDGKLTYSPLRVELETLIANLLKERISQTTDPERAALAELQARYPPAAVVETV